MKHLTKTSKVLCVAHSESRRLDLLNLYVSKASNHWSLLSKQANVYQLILQVPFFDMQSRSTSGDQPTAELMASFLPTLGFYIGHSLNPAAFDEYMVLSQIWAQAAAHFARHPYVASVVAEELMCSQIVDLLSWQIINLDADKVQQNLTPEKLASFGDPAAVLMLCIRYIRTAAIKKGYQRGLTADDTLASELDAMYQLRAQKISKQMRPSVSNVGTSPLSPHVALLRATMLIVKAASLSPEVHGNPPKPYSAKRSLWNTAQTISAQAHTSAMQASSQLPSLPEPGPLWADLHQAHQMSSWTVQLVTSVLRRHLKEASHEEHEPKESMLVNCCLIMNAFLTATNSPVLQKLSQTVAQAIVSSGMPFTTVCSGLCSLHVSTNITCLTMMTVRLLDAGSNVETTTCWIGTAFLLT